ncbi:MAG: 2'-5' RNA ligase family protein [Betaproteobacteria bacterium]|nr:2'-5' RNA ligase family protein [Betaproteobacteria bacterium]
MQQGFLTGIEPLRPLLYPGENWFFALRVPQQAAERIHDLAFRLRNQHNLRGEPFPLWQYHVSLQGLMPQPLRNESWLTAGLRAGGSVRAAPFSVQFDRVVTLPGGSREASRRSACVLTASGDGDLGVRLLRNLLGTSMKTANLKGASLGRFLPHVSMLYDEVRVPQYGVEPIRWTATEFVLIHRPERGAKYEQFESWPLEA